MDWTERVWGHTPFNANVAKSSRLYIYDYASSGPSVVVKQVKWVRKEAEEVLKWAKMLEHPHPYINQILDLEVECNPVGSLFFYVFSKPMPTTFSVILQSDLQTSTFTAKQNCGDCTLTC
jgi:hypothetical protein